MSHLIRLQRWLCNSWRSGVAKLFRRICGLLGNNDKQVRKFLAQDAESYWPWPFGISGQSWHPNFNNPQDFLTAIKSIHACICFSSSLEGKLQTLLDKLNTHYAIRQCNTTPKTTRFFKMQIISSPSSIWLIISVRQWSRSPWYYSQTIRITIMSCRSWKCP